MNRLIRILLFLVLAFFAKQSRATHIIGGELFYTHIDSVNYEVTLKIYRDCYNGVPWFDVPARIKIFDSNNNYLQMHYMYNYTWSYLDPYVDSLCIIIPPNVCVQEAIYTDIISLPPIPGGYQMSYTRCCRNSTILNINGPDTVGITLLATIPDTSVVDTNSSPSFNNFPPILICAGQPLEFDHSASDPDGDSLVYELCTPFHGGNIPNVYGVSPVEAPPYTQVPWTAPYYEQDPLGGVPLTIDSLGLLTGIPNTIGQFVVGVCVYEYRDGELLSVNTRDFQFNVLPCEPVPTAAIPADMFICTDSTNTVVFDIESVQNAISFSWDFGDLTTNADTSHLQAPSYSYPDTGYYDITLIVNEGYTCEDTGYAQVYIQPGVEAQFTTQNVCYPSVVSFNGYPVIYNGTLDNVSWYFEPGSTSSNLIEQYQFSEPGSYPVSFVVENNYGCSDSIVSTLEVYEKPIADFVSDTACLGSFSNLTSTSIANSSVIQNYIWDFTDTTIFNSSNVSYLYSTEGVYQVTLTIQNQYGCRDTVISDALVSDIPNSDFSSLLGCVGDPTMFTNLTTFQALIEGYTWWIDTIQEGSFNENPVFYFSAPGTYDMMLIAENIYGCVDTIVKPLNVYYDPNADFDFTNVCLGDTTNFLDQSTVQSSNIISYQWYFGAVGTSFDQNPQFVFTQSGSKQVGLIVYSQDGCVDTVFQTVEVYEMPTAHFQVNSICLNDSITFQDESSINNDTISNWTWNFDNGSFSSEQNPSTIFNSSGYYSVNLSLESVHGCVDNYDSLIRILNLPILSVSVEDICEGNLVNIIDQSLSEDTIVEWNWIVDNDSFASQNVTDIIFPTAGNYPIQLIVTTQNGCVDTFLTATSVFPNPEANFTVESDCESDIATFTDNSSIATGQIVDWNWNFGDGSTTNDQNNTHTFSGSGEFEVLLIVESDNGCTDTISETVINLESIEASFYVNEDKGCAPLITSVFVTTSGELEYHWEFSNGVESDSSAVNLEFAEPGSYGLYLHITNLEGCSDSIEIPAMFTVYGNPEANFSFTPEEASIYSPGFQYLNGSSSDAEEFIWSFGDGEISTEEDPWHLYQDTGVYSVNLIAKNQYGCIDSIEYNVLVNGNFFVFYIPNTFTPNDNNVNDVFNGRGIGIVNYEMNIFNRWGERIYTTTDPNAGWEGTRAGVPSEIGTYVYRIDILDVLGEKHKYVGHVNLVR